MPRVLIPTLVSQWHEEPPTKTTAFQFNVLISQNALPRLSARYPTTFREVADDV